MLRPYLRYASVIIAVSFLSACATNTSSTSQSQTYGFKSSCGFLCKIERPVRISEANYMISGSNGGGSIIPKLLIAASGFCGTKNQELLALNKEEEFRGGTTYGSVEFSCKSYQ
jgi:hypothetical protein